VVTIKPAICYLSIVLLLLLAMPAWAAVSIVESDATVIADYSGFTDEDQDTIAVTGQVTVQNTDANSTTVRIAVTDLPVDYTVNTISDVAVPGNGTAVVSFTINVPHEENSGTKAIGNVVLRDTNNVEQDRVVLNQDTLSMLSLEDFEVDYTDEAGDDQTDEFDADDLEFELDNNVQAGSEVTISIKLENLFDEDYDEDKAALEQVTINIEADDDDLFDNSFDEEEDLDDLEASDKQTFSITIPISEEADAQDYTLEFTFEAEDGEGARHEVVRELVLQVERERNDVRINTATVTPPTVSLCEGSFTLDAELKNYGTRAQRYAALNVYNGVLGIDEKVSPIELGEFSDRDDTWTRSFNFDVSEAKPGTYALDLKAYYDYTKLIDTERINIAITACTTGTSGTTPTVITTTIDGTSGTAGGLSVSNRLTPPAGTTPSSSIVESIERSSGNDDLIVGLMIAGVVLLVVLLGVFVALLFK